MEPSEPGEAEQARPFRSAIRVLNIVLLLAFLQACRQPAKENATSLVSQKDTAGPQKKPKDTTEQQPAKKGYIYLTFDDGPNKGTLNVYRTIKEEQVPASFFIVGRHVDDTPEQRQVWEQLKADSAIELCNHSYSHARNKYTSYYENPSGVIGDFEKNQERLGFTNRIIRMPGRNAWRIGRVNHTDISESRKAIDSVRKAGFEIMGWDIEWTFDHKSLLPDADTALLLRRIQNMLESGHTRTPGHLVLLAHDQSFRRDSTVAMLKEFIGRLKSSGEFELVLASYYPRDQE